MKQLKVTRPDGETRIVAIANKDFYMQQAGYKVELIETPNTPETMSETERRLRARIITLEAEVARLKAENADLRTKLEAAEAAKPTLTTAKKKATTKQ